MTGQFHILIVDDDLKLRTLLRDYLHRHAFRVTAVSDGTAMWAEIQGGRVDLVILDIMLPGEDGLTLCSHLRALHDIPVIMLTALGETTDRIVGLEVGADDYLSKPFDPRELLARIKVVMRRAAGPAQSTSGQNETRNLYFAGWTLDRTARNLTSPQGRKVSLSGGEYQLLEVLLEHPNRVLSRGQILEYTQGRHANPFDRSIDVQIGRLRRRLGDNGREPTIIRTVRGAGYVLAASVEKRPCED